MRFASIFHWICWCVSGDLLVFFWRFPGMRFASIFHWICWYYSVHFLVLFIRCVGIIVEIC